MLAVMSLLSDISSLFRVDKEEEEENGQQFGKERRSYKEGGEGTRSAAGTTKSGLQGCQVGKVKRPDKISRKQTLNKIMPKKAIWHTG